MNYELQTFFVTLQKIKLQTSYEQNTFRLAFYVQA